MLTHNFRWSHDAGNQMVPSPWQATVRGGRRPAHPSTMVTADTFGSSRARARNIAGVNFQALASCHLLIGSCGLVVDRLRPEGDEDCDLLVASGDAAEERLIRVQVKRSAGDSNVPSRQR